MYIKDGIAYAGEPKPILQVNGVRALNDHQLWVRFNNGEEKTINFKPLLEHPAFAVLKDENIFKQAYIDYGTVVWNDGEIDISSEYLYSA